MIDQLTETAIIGNGLHGIGVGVNLAAQGDRLFTIVGPGEPLSDWRRVTQGQGMTHLRSKVAHRLTDPNDRDYHPRDYAAAARLDYRAHLTPSDQPTLRLMDGYHRSIIEKAGIEKAFLKGTVVKVDRTREGFETLVQANDGGEGTTLHSRNVVFALGLGKPNIPAIQGVDTEGVTHSHYFNANADWRRKHVLVVGAGQSGWTLANSIIKNGGRVTLTSRSTPNVQRLDFDPEYFNGSLLDSFRWMSLDAREVELRTQFAQGHVHPDTQEAAFSHGWDRFKLREFTEVRHFKRRGYYVEADGVGKFDQVVLATGYHFDLDDYGFAHGVFRGLDRRMGLPRVDTNSFTTDVPGLYFVGRAAAFAHGPASGNHGMVDANAYAVATSINPHSFLQPVTRTTV